jgi:hypothetical protein
LQVAQGFTPGAKQRMFYRKEREKKKCQTDGILAQKGEPGLCCTVIKNSYLTLDPCNLLISEALMQLANN